jgi:hypothetical protein
MSKFEERLLGDLVQRHGIAISEAVRPAPRPSHARPLWIGTGVLTIAGAVAVALSVFGGSAPAFAVSQDAEGVVKLSIEDISAVDAANAELRKIGAPVLAVPMTADCKDTFEVDEGSAGEMSGTGTLSDDEGSVTIPTKGLRPGTTVLVAAKKDRNSIALSVSYSVRGKVPSCLPDAPGLQDAPRVPVGSAGANGAVPLSPTEQGR